MLKLFKRRIRLLIEQENPESIVHPGRFRVSREQVIEHLARLDLLSHGHVVGSPSCHHHDFASIGRRLRRKKRHTKHVKAKCFNNAWTLVPFTRKLSQSIKPQLELFKPRKKYCSVIANYRDELLLTTKPKQACMLKINNGSVILFSLKFAKPQHCCGRCE